MDDLVPDFDPNETSVLSLIKFIPSNQEEFYSIALCASPEVLISHQNQVIIFRQPQSARMAFKYVPQNFIGKDRAPPTEIFTKFDLPEATRLLEIGKADQGATILDALNMSLDIAGQLDLPVESSTRGTVENMADRLTFNPSLEGFPTGQRNTAQGFTETALKALQKNAKFID